MNINGKVREKAAQSRLWIKSIKEKNKAYAERCDMASY